MTRFTDMVSKFANDKTRNGEGGISNGTDTAAIKNSKKRTIKTEDVEVEETGSSTSELSTQVRKSLRLSSATSNDTPGPFISRTVSADSVKTRPHHKRAAVIETVKKEETTVVVSVLVYTHINLLQVLVFFEGYC